MGFGVPCCWLLGWGDMSLGKILLFYKFTPIADPQAMRLWQRDLCELLGLTGRILISEHGINGTLGGDMEDCKRYVRKFREYPGFKDTQFKWSAGRADDFNGVPLVPEVDLGDPTSDVIRDGDLFRREFTGGVARINLSETTSIDGLRPHSGSVEAS